MCRSQQQPNTEPVLKLRDRFGDGGLSDTKLLSRTGERAGIDNADECLHRSQAVHCQSSQDREVRFRQE